MEATVTFEGDMFKLTTDNFSYWKPMMEDHLYCKDLHEPIIMKDKPEGKDDKAWEILNRKAVAVIRKYVDRSLFEHVSTYTNAFELWTKLESMIQKKTPRNKALFVRRLVKLEYKDGQSMIEHLNNFKGIVNQLNKVDMKVEDEMQALLLLSSLPESWDTLVVTLSNSAPEGKLTMDTVTDSLLNEEVRRKERGSSSYSEANIVDRRGREETRGQNRSRGRDQSRGRSKSRPRVTCYYCGKQGHMKSECRFFKKDKQAGNIKPDRFNPTKKHEDKTTTIVEDQSEELYLVGECNLSSDDSSWIVDSGASFHVTPHGSFFTTYQSGDFGNVQMGNQGRSKIIGKGDVILTSNTGCKIVLKDVRHVPDMRLNLISTGKLDDVGLDSHFGGGKWKLTKGSLIMARGRKEGSLFARKK